MKMKISTSTLLVLLASFLTGCFDTCGIYGSSSSFTDEFVIDRPFEPITVTKGETLIFRPETYVHINYTYSGSSNCRRDDYQDGPSYVHPTVLNDSLATAKEFYDSDSVPIWRGTEMKIRITGKEVGQTILSLEIEWYVEGRDDFFRRSRDFEIELTVIEPN